jgi:hypothetical protein
MSLKSLTNQTVAKINSTLGGALQEADVASLSKIVEEALIVAVNESTAHCNDAVKMCCGPEADLAHKIAEDVERARYALLANLASMR